MKAIVTVMGADKVGVVSQVSTALANANVNIKKIDFIDADDIHRTELTVDISDMGASRKSLEKIMRYCAEKLCMEISVEYMGAADAQVEEVFDLG